MQILRGACRSPAASCSSFSDPGSSPGCEQNLSKRAPCGARGVQTGSAGSAKGLVLQQTCKLFPIPLLVHSTGAPYPKKTRSSNITRGPAKVSGKAPADGPASLGRVRQVEQEEIQAGRQVPKLFWGSLVCVGHPHHGCEDRPRSPSCRWVSAA